MLDKMHADPLEQLAVSDGVLAVLTGVQGSAYRQVGAHMAFLGDGDRTGAVSSGCVEDALALEADRVAKGQKAENVRYGHGSPWIDIRLPCGAGLDVTLWPSRRDAILKDAVKTMRAREAASLILPQSGLADASVGALSIAGWRGAAFCLPRIPPLRIKVFGEGVETFVFARLAHYAGYAVEVFSDEKGERRGLPDDISINALRSDDADCTDQQTAIVLFFHDHAMEIEILAAALKSPAFWIGAQGSARAQMARRKRLIECGVGAAAMARLQSRIGLIASTRDPQTLSVSVLSDIVQAYKATWLDPYFGDRGSGALA